MPKAIAFDTVPTELVEHAVIAHRHFSDLGYSIQIEPTEVHFERCPAMLLKRNHTKVAIEVCSIINLPALRAWVSLGQSLTEDFRVAICVPKSVASAKTFAKAQSECKALKVGIYVSEHGSLTEWVSPSDLNINVVLPPLRDLHKNTRRALGSTYEQFHRSQWREGFEDACKALEQKLRPYLARAIKNDLLTIIENGRAKNPTPAKVAKMTLGQLGHAFQNARPITAMVTQISNNLDLINKDRVGVAHKINRAQTEVSLRKNVGRHMHAIVRTLDRLARP